jgi:hypothetical protein
MVHITYLLPVEMVPTDSGLKKFQFLPKIKWLPDMPLLFPETLFLQQMLERYPVKKMHAHSRSHSDTASNFPFKV